MIVDNKGGMFIRDTPQRRSQSVTFINEERDVLKSNTLSQVKFRIRIQKNLRYYVQHVDERDVTKRYTPAPAVSN